MTVNVVDNGPRKITRSIEVARPAGELFALVADPHRHHELDGSGTVRDAIKGPDTLAEGDKFSVKMKMFGLPYKITSRVTEYDENKVIEWRHPMGHRWRWSFEATSPSETTVTEVFDFHRGGGLGIKLLGFPRRNAAGIEATLQRLQDRFAH